MLMSHNSPGSQGVDNSIETYADICCGWVRAGEHTVIVGQQSNTNTCACQQVRTMSPCLHPAAFNATENRSNHEIVRFLESIGAQFGACQVSQKTFLTPFNPFLSFFDISNVQNNTNQPTTSPHVQVPTLTHA